jgi:hypothetical protein
VDHFKLYWDDVSLWESTSQTNLNKSVHATEVQSDKEYNLIMNSYKEKIPRFIMIQCDEPPIVVKDESEQKA